MTTAPSCVGLDIGTTALRAVQVNQRKGTVTHAAEIPLDAGVLSHGQVLEPKALVKGLRSLWRAGKFTTRRVAFAVPDTSVLTRQVDLPWMPPEDFRAALRWQVGESLPVDLATVELDYRPIEVFTSRDQHGQELRMQRCLLVASSTAGITDTCRLLAKARLEPFAADVASFALLRAALACEPAAARSRTQALIDIGAGDITVVIHSDGQPRFIRAVPHRAGASIIEDLADQLGMDQEAACGILWQVGLNGPPPVTAAIAESSIFSALAAPSAVEADPQVTHALEVINPWAKALVGHIRDSLDYFQSGSGRDPVEHLTITGRLASLEGLTGRLSTELRLPVTELSLVDGPHWERRAQKNASPTMALALGLALRSREGGSNT